MPKLIQISMMTLALGLLAACTVPAQLLPATPTTTPTAAPTATSASEPSPTAVLQPLAPTGGNAAGIHLIKHVVVIMQ